MNDRKILLFLYTLSHFLVDFSCALLIFQEIRSSSFFYQGLFVYNFSAFALQMPLGVLADRIRRSGRIAGIGCLLTALPLLFPLPAVSSVLLAGTGNALFHLGGGVSILRRSPERCLEPGIFVSSGAVGIWLGTLWGKNGGFSLLLPGLLLLSFIFFFAFLPKDSFPPAQNTLPSFVSGAKHPPFLPGLSFLLLMFVICLRSFLGMIQIFPWKDSVIMSFLLALATAGGKALGGFFADRFGIFPTCLVSLGLASVLYLGSGFPFTGLLAVLFFNMTMPLVLIALTKLLPGHPGFCFGALTFSLFLGFLPSYLNGSLFPGILPSRSLPGLYAALSLLSLAVMVFTRKSWRRQL